MATETETTMTTKAPQAQVDAGDMSTDSTRNGDNHFMDAHDVAAPADGNPEFFYLKGWRLWAVMCTLYLSTLLAALDVVSITCCPHLFNLYWRWPYF
jgi:hypothetical protein